MNYRDLEDRTRRAAANAKFENKRRERQLQLECQLDLYIEPLFDSEMSHFPRRPPLAKDKAALRRIYGE